MFRKFGLVAAVCAAVTVGGAASAAPTEVYVIATIHGLHGKSVGYSYDTLYKLVDVLHPDYVGVEIRQEDLARPDSYLQKSYPTEMIYEARLRGAHAFGFDWLGDDIANEAVPDDWGAKQSPLKRLEREVNADPQYKDAQSDSISDAEQNILADATPAGMNDGRYDRLNDSYYARMHEQLRGTKYEAIPQFYAQRDQHIAANVSAAIRQHPGARFVILTGADHRSAMLRYLQQGFGDAIRIMPLPSN